MMMRVSPTIQAPKLGNLQREVFPITRTRICFARQLCFCQSETGRELSTHEIRDILVDVVENFPNTPGKETPKLASPTRSSSNLKKLRAIARVSEIGVDGHLPPHTLYLLDLGLDLDQIKSITRRFPGFVYCSIEGKIKPVVEFLLVLGVNRADIPTILYRSPQLCAISLTENLIPTMTYLESLGVEKKKWAKVIYRFPTMLTCSRQKLKATVDFFYELGLTSESVGKVLTRYPVIVGCSVEENLRPTAQYFRLLGVDIAHLLHRAPVVFGLSVTKNIIPTMTYLESLGVDKKKWAKVIYRCPGVLTFSRQKMKAIADFFYELGLTVESVGKILTRYPQIVGSNVEENLRPTAEYFNSLGVDVAVLVYRAPQVLCLSIPRKLKPITEFFLEKGYTIEEVRTMLSRSANLFCLSLQSNLIPKWEFFLTMDYPKSELIKFPRYFTYSLEERIKPRYAMVRESGVRFCLAELLCAEPVFEEILKRRVKKKLDGLVRSNMEGLKLQVLNDTTG